MLTRARAAVLVVAGLTLTACGNVHPGAAAVVDDQTISMKSIDKDAAVYCRAALLTAQQQGSTAPVNSDIRRQAVTSAVSLVVARKLAAEAGVVPKPSAYEVTSEAERKAVAKAFTKIDLDQAIKVIEDNREISAIAVSLGEKSTGQAPTADNEAQLAEAGQAEITKAFAKNDVSFAPRFGLSSSSKAVAATGSLSVEPTDLGDADADQLPAAQRCT